MRTYLFCLAAVFTFHLANFGFKLLWVWYLDNDPPRRRQ